MNGKITNENLTVQRVKFQIKMGGQGLTSGVLGEGGGGEKPPNGAEHFRVPKSSI